MNHDRDNIMSRWPGKEIAEMKAEETQAQKRGAFIPETPGGTVLMHLKAATEEKAWANLLRDAAHMPYQGVEGFRARGYKVEFWERKA